MKNRDFLKLLDNFPCKGVSARIININTEKEIEGAVTVVDAMVLAGIAKSKGEL